MSSSIPRPIHCCLTRLPEPRTLLSTTLINYRLKGTESHHVSLSLRSRRSLLLSERIPLATLGNTGLDVLPLDVVGVVGLDIGGETVQSALDSFLGGRIHHAGLSQHSVNPKLLYLMCPFCNTYILRRIIRAPADESNLVARALATLQFILDIKDRIATANALLAPPVLALCV